MILTTFDPDEYVYRAELNALNASHAAIRWKKYREVYADLGTEHHSTFSVATNRTVNDDGSIAGTVEQI